MQFYVRKSLVGNSKQRCTAQVFLPLLHSREQGPVVKLFNPITPFSGLLSGGLVITAPLQKHTVVFHKPLGGSSPKLDQRRSCSQDMPPLPPTPFKSHSSVQRQAEGLIAAPSQARPRTPKGKRRVASAVQHHGAEQLGDSSENGGQTQHSLLSPGTEPGREGVCGAALV